MIDWISFVLGVQLIIIMWLVVTVVNLKSYHKIRTGKKKVKKEAKE